MTKTARGTRSVSSDNFPLYFISIPLSERMIPWRMAYPRCKDGGLVSSLERAVFSSYRVANECRNISGMEDAHATVLNLDEKVGDEKASFFAVYDGHGGT